MRAVTTASSEIHVGPFWVEGHGHKRLHIQLHTHPRTWPNMAANDNQGIANGGRSRRKPPVAPRIAGSNPDQLKRGILGVIWSNNSERLLSD